MFYDYLICRGCLEWTMHFKIVFLGATHYFVGVQDVKFSFPVTHSLKWKKNKIYSSSRSKSIPSGASLKLLKADSVHCMC